VTLSSTECSEASRGFTSLGAPQKKEGNCFFNEEGEDRRRKGGEGEAERRGKRKGGRHGSGERVRKTGKGKEGGKER
jgi:hypothetical protein